MSKGRTLPSGGKPDANGLPRAFSSPLKVSRELQINPESKPEWPRNTNRQDAINPLYKRHKIGFKRSRSRTERATFPGGPTCPPSLLLKLCVNLLIARETHRIVA